jgi:hypothetical protein
VPRGGGSSAGSDRSSHASGGSTRSRDSAADHAQPSAAGSVGGRRTRGGESIVGSAVPRGTVGIRGRDRIVFVPSGYGFYPWGYGGLGFVGYYGGYYDPWYSYGGFGYPYYPSLYARGGEDGALRLKVKPRDASVYVDGFYVGRVEDFNGVFQRLHLSEGAHRIEIRDPDYEPLAFDVRIEVDRTITYHGELRKIQ